MSATRWACILALLMSSPAWAQSPNYPDKPVRLVVPFTPGGSSDIVSRLLAQKLAEFWGQQFVIDNRPGAGGALGAETVAKAAPDGYTILFANPGPAVHNVVLRKNPAYALADFAPVVYVGYTPNVIAAYPKLPANNLKELVAYGADVNAKDSDGLTALDYSLARARVGFLQQKPPVRNDLAKVLKDLGATVENPNLPPWPSVPTPTITAQVPD